VLHAQQRDTQSQEYTMLRPSLKKTINRLFRPHLFRATHRHKSELVRVNAIDHDGCFGLPYLEPQDISKNHIMVIEELKQQREVNGYTFDYITIFSNRQAINFDCHNAIINQNNLAASVAINIAKSLNAYFDPLLLADITANELPGTTIRTLKEELARKGIKKLEQKIPEEILLNLIQEKNMGFCFSEDKINIAYAQMHRLALIHPHAIITYNVYDDLRKNILKPLSKFYRNYPNMIPSNVKLVLYHYDTTRHCSLRGLSLPELITSIAGTGTTDISYYHTINAMTDIARQIEGKKSMYNMAEYLTPKLITEAIMLRVPSHSPRV
jgi:hypothetical protein